MSGPVRKEAGEAGASEGVNDERLRLRRLRREKRRLSRKQKGSASWEKQKERLSRVEGGPNKKGCRTARGAPCDGAGRRGTRGAGGADGVVRPPIANVHRPKGNAMTEPTTAAAPEIAVNDGYATYVFPECEFRVRAVGFEDLKPAFGVDDGFFEQAEVCSFEGSLFVQPSSLGVLPEAAVRTVRRRTAAAQMKDRDTAVAEGMVPEVCFAPTGGGVPIETAAIEASERFVFARGALWEQCAVPVWTVLKHRFDGEVIVLPTIATFTRPEGMRFLSCAEAMYERSDFRADALEDALAFARSLAGCDVDPDGGIEIYDASFVCGDPERARLERELDEAKRAVDAANERYVAAKQALERCQPIVRSASERQRS